MAISLNIRPLITYPNNEIENKGWINKGVVHQDDILKAIKKIDWLEEARNLNNTINKNNDLTIFNVSEPCFNLHNQQTESELYVGLLGEDYFDLTLTTFENDSMNEVKIYGFYSKDIYDIVKLFYQEEYNRIYSYSEESNRKSPIKELLIARDAEQTKLYSKDRKFNLSLYGITFITLAILYFILK
jgi:hypothetical protein